jgi:superfamily II DNA or RNA helicase
MTSEDIVMGSGGRERPRRGGSELFIVDNGDDDWKVRDYLREWAELAKQMDIATGTFEIGGLLALDGQWQKLEKIRILLGDEVSKRTQQTLVEGVERIKGTLDRSLEREKETNDFLLGVPGILDAMRRRQIECKVYNKNKFHAKAFITQAKQEVVGSVALVGSSNFTGPGLTKNVELNIQIRREVEQLQAWYDRHWEEAEEITPDILKVIERHTREYSPFEIYAKSLQEFFRGHELTAGEWELLEPALGGSHLYNKLDQYQKEGYHSLLKIARSFNGALLCDGVGLGKTFIGMMLIERLLMFDRKRVALLVPKAARASVWQATLDRYLPHLAGEYSNLEILNHSDLLRGGDYPRKIRRIKDMADVLIIDEAHHFRNPGTRGKSRYWQLFDLAEGKTVFMLTATPVNNRLRDLQHMIELFSRRRTDYFSSAPLGIHSLDGHFRKLENALEKLMIARSEASEKDAKETNAAEAEEVLFNDDLFRQIVVQRSRAYVIQSQKQHGGTNAIFPKRDDPQVVEYSLKKSYGKLLAMIEEAFSKKIPLFALATYYPLYYYKGPDQEIDPLEEGRQKQLVTLIRTQFLKRFESSAKAFEMSCENLLVKLLAWVTRHVSSAAEKKRLERWKAQNAEVLERIQSHSNEFYGEEGPEDPDEDIISDEMLEDIEELNRDHYKVEEIIEETMLDLDQLVKFLNELKDLDASHDDKLQQLIRLLKTDPVLKRHKVLIFSEFMATARYVKKELVKTSIDHVDEVDSATKRDREYILKQFAPYYNESSSADLRREGLPETRVLISTDVLSEGLNLQDATRLINYDLHWNPVRLMQRIGRVDRRMNQETEERMVNDHPEYAPLRGSVRYWNFLPPDELERLLRLYRLVSHKTLRISKVFGIEGKRLLKPDDDFEALKDFIHQYEGSTSLYEEMHLEYQRLLRDDPQLAERLKLLPCRVFSGKEHPQASSKGVFFCYALPAPAAVNPGNGGSPPLWTEEAGVSRWYLYDIASKSITSDPEKIHTIVKCLPETPRHCAQSAETLKEIREAVEKHIKNSYLRGMQAPIGVAPILKAWMELS